MKCCVECFKDIYVRSTIEKLGAVGDCDYCPNKGIAVYDISKVPNPIADAIISLVQIYAVSDLPVAKPLKLTFHEDWDIFNVSSPMIETLVKDLCASVINPNSDIFTQPVTVSQLFDEDFLNAFGVVRGFRWEQFSESIKYKNRFHIDMFNADVFVSLLSMIAKQYPAGTTFCRARITDKPQGFSGKDMGAPPQEKRSAGRINPEGISVLYLSSDDRTVLNEVRASIFDYVTIGTFKSLKDITIANLSGISETSPFLYDDGLEKYAANRKVFQEIANNIAKPLRRSDSHLEYLPTQYIAEFIKSQSYRNRLYDGVEYASTLKEGGHNIAIFDEKLFEWVEVKTIEITNVQYETR